MVVAQLEQAAEAAYKLADYGPMGVMLLIAIGSLFLLIRYILGRADIQTSELLSRIDKLIVDHSADRAAYQEESKLNRQLYQEDTKALRDTYSRATSELTDKLVAALKEQKDARQ